MKAPESHGSHRLCKRDTLPLNTSVRFAWRLHVAPEAGGGLSCELVGRLAL